MSIVNENKDMSCRPCQGWHAFLQSPGRWTSTHWSRWNCLDGTKSG